jgi:hypothetical protein
MILLLQTDDHFEFEPTQIRVFMSTQVINIILYSIGLVLSTIGACVAISILSMIFFNRSTTRGDNVDYMILTNIYITLFLGFSFFMDMCIYSIYGHLHPNSSFDGWWCRVKSFIVQSGMCGFFYTFLLQAIYRLCCIVYPTRVKFQSKRLYIILSIVRMVLAFLQMLPSLLLGDIEYLSNEYHCQVPPTNIRATVIITFFVYLLPFCAIAICYVRTIFHVRTETTVLVTIKQHASTHRDLIVSTRVVIVLGFLTITGMPHLITTVIYANTGRLPSWAVPFEWLMTILGSTSISIIQIFISPHLKKLRARMHRVEPVIATMHAVHAQL